AFESRAPIIKSHRRQRSVDLRVEASVRVRSVIRSARPGSGRAPGLPDAGGTRVDMPSAQHRVEFPLRLTIDERREIELVDIHFHANLLELILNDHSHVHTILA